jgi:hypothetical protein
MSVNKTDFVGRERSGIHGVYHVSIFINIDYIQNVGVLLYYITECLTLIMCFEYLTITIVRNYFVF